MILQFPKKTGVSKKASLGLVPNSFDLKYMLDNTKAVYEIRRIVQGTQYSMQDVWREINEDLLLSKEARKEAT